MIKNSLIILILISIASLAFAPSLISSLCKIEHCNLCLIATHHSDKWVNFFSLFIKINTYLLFLAIIFISAKTFSNIKLKYSLYKDYDDQKIYLKQKLLIFFNYLLFNPLMRAYSDGVLRPKIYKA